MELLGGSQTTAYAAKTTLHYNKQTFPLSVQAGLSREKIVMIRNIIVVTLVSFDNIKKYKKEDKTPRIYMDCSINPINQVIMSCNFSSGG